jgi:hypothetical protein
MMPRKVAVRKHAVIPARARPHIRRAHIRHIAFRRIPNAHDRLSAIRSSPSLNSPSALESYTTRFAERTAERETAAQLRLDARLERSERRRGRESSNEQRRYDERVSRAEKERVKRDAVDMKRQFDARIAKLSSIKDNAKFALAREDLLDAFIGALGSDHAENAEAMRLFNMSINEVNREHYAGQPPISYEEHLAEEGVDYSMSDEQKEALTEEVKQLDESAHRAEAEKRRRVR